MRTTLQHFIPGYKYLSEKTLRGLIFDLQLELRYCEAEGATAAAWAEAEEEQA